LEENCEAASGRHPRDSGEPALIRRRLTLEGLLQGVGFRPHVYRLAQQEGIAGWVRNDLRGVALEVEGPPSYVERFLAKLRHQLPPPARIDSWQLSPLPPQGDGEFVIRASAPPEGDARDSTAAILADLAPCQECLDELFDAGNRRFAYPFLNCTHCGPRFSIVQALPYDRSRTTMRHFAMCPACRREYDDPQDRRFHAQPNACPQCGPTLAWCDASGKVLARGETALAATASALADGSLVALKGVGGFQLLAAAGSAAAVRRLRERKARPTQPLAIMVASLAQARQMCQVSESEAGLLTSPAAPIVLLERQPGDLLTNSLVAEAVAPNQPRWGVMLPSSPLHQLLLQAFPFPVVATSGNRHDDPISSDNEEALERLGSIADYFLLHDRPIARPIDDSVTMVVDGIPRVWRRARGYAPLPFPLPLSGSTILALGADQKNTIALRIDRQVVVSQHVGDLETERAIEMCRGTIEDLLLIYSAAPEWIVHDAHPDYHTTRLAQSIADVYPRARVLAVQHHHAHLASCLAEHGLWDEEVLGVIWDGTGYGTDGTIWGGEFLAGNLRRFRRVAAFRNFSLVGGERAILEPRRVALALLWQVHGESVWETPWGRTFPVQQRRNLSRMLDSGRHCAATSSVGRLFDGLAALVDPQQQATYSAEAAMALETIVEPGETGSYPLSLERSDTGILRCDWRPLIRQAADDLIRGVSGSIVAARFHHALARTVPEVARHAGLPRVALSGGCFQNRQLLQLVRHYLHEAGFDVLDHRQIPTGDGGISLGQAAVAAAQQAAG
jgi:hydrogenase maturation protein HypF